jgi:SAM-dependent methyltransferase
LASRVGQLSPDQAEDQFRWLGEFLKRQILQMLPRDWTWEGKRVLDFGCGAGRVLRSFMSEASSAEFYGCDIHAPSIEWLRNNLSPPFKVETCSESPPLSFPDGHFDLIYAASVFTHITDAWAAWLQEMNRVLKVDGFFVASFLGKGMIGPLIGESWDEGRIGMNVLRKNAPWDVGGPSVFHSPWWLRAHWGRAFEILALSDSGATGSHGWVLARKRWESPPVEELTRIEAGEPRERAAAEHNDEQLRDEATRDMAGLQQDNAELRYWLGQIRSSPSWRLTRPLRALARLVRANR